MSLWEKIFGSRQKHSFGAPLEHKCEQCGKALHTGTGLSIAGGMGVLDHIMKRALQCPNCLRIFCGLCSKETDEKLGRPKGATEFVCPFCRTGGIAPN